MTTGDQWQESHGLIDVIATRRRRYPPGRKVSATPPPADGGPTATSDHSRSSCAGQLVSAAGVLRHNLLGSAPGRFGRLFECVVSNLAAVADDIVLAERTGGHQKHSAPDSCPTHAFWMENLLHPSVKFNSNGVVEPHRYSVTVPQMVNRSIQWDVANICLDTVLSRPDGVPVVSLGSPPDVELGIVQTSGGISARLYLGDLDDSITSFVWRVSSAGATSNAESVRRYRYRPREPDDCVTIANAFSTPLLPARLAVQRSVACWERTGVSLPSKVDLRFTSPLAMKEVQALFPRDLFKGFAASSPESSSIEVTHLSVGSDALTLYYRFDPLTMGYDVRNTSTPAAATDQDATRDPASCSADFDQLIQRPAYERAWHAPQIPLFKGKAANRLFWAQTFGRKHLLWELPAQGAVLNRDEIWGLLTAALDDQKGKRYSVHKARKDITGSSEVRRKSAHEVWNALHANNTDASGISIVIRHIELFAERPEKFTDLHDQLVNAFGVDVGINLYLSSRGAQTLPAHTDRYDVLAIQLAGSKEWNICPPKQLSDLNVGDAAQMAEIERGKVMGCTVYEDWMLQSDFACTAQKLDVNHALYLPKGVVHVAETGAGLSIHLTVSIKREGTSWLSVFRDAIRIVQASQDQGTALAEVRILQEDLAAASVQLEELSAESPAGIAWHRPIPRHLDSPANSDVMQHLEDLSCQLVGRLYRVDPAAAGRVAQVLSRDVLQDAAHHLWLGNGTDLSDFARNPDQDQKCSDAESSLDVLSGRSRRAAACVRGSTFTCPDGTTPPLSVGGCTTDCTSSCDPRGASCACDGRGACGCDCSSNCDGYYGSGCDTDGCCGCDGAANSCGCDASTTVCDECDGCDSCTVDCNACANSCPAGQILTGCGTGGGFGTVGTCEPCSECPANQFATVACSGLTNTQCRSCDNQQCPTNQFREGECGGIVNGYTCTQCSNVTCALTFVRKGTCSGTQNGFRCEQCANLTCADGITHRTGLCSGANDGYMCPTCTECPAGQYRSSGCHGTQDSRCTATTTCLPIQFEFVAATPTTDRLCNHAQRCDHEGGEYTLTEITATTDRVCATHSAECSGEEYQAAAPTLSSDRICREISPPCENGTEYLRSFPTATSDRDCQTCRNNECSDGLFQVGRCTLFTQGYGCSACANESCPAGQVRHGQCSGRVNGWYCEECTNSECPVDQHQAGQCVGEIDGFTCLNCSNLECPDNEFRTGTCAGRSNGFECHPCDNQECQPRMYRAGECSGVRNEWECAACDNINCGSREWRYGNCSGAENGYDCRPVSVGCTAGTFFDGIEATRLSDIGCVACPANHFNPTISHRRPECLPARSCTDGEYESRAPTTTTDRECSACPVGSYETLDFHILPNCSCSTSDCAPGTYEVQAPTTSTDRVCDVCQSCALCTLEEQSLREDNRTCASLIRDCVEDPRCHGCLRESNEGLVGAGSTSCGRYFEYRAAIACLPAANAPTRAMLSTMNISVGSPSEDDQRCNRVLGQLERQPSFSTCVDRRALLFEQLYAQDEYRMCNATFTGDFNTAECHLSAASCSPGTYQRAAVTVSADRVCAPCPHGSFSPNYSRDSACPGSWNTTCAAGDFQLAPPSTVSDAVCQAPRACTAGTFMESDFTATTDRVCTRCVDGTYQDNHTHVEESCLNHTSACPPAHYRLIDATSVSDIVCDPWKRCPFNAIASSLPTATSDTVCQQCSDDEFVNTTALYPTECVENPGRSTGVDRESGLFGFSPWQIATFLLAILVVILILNNQWKKRFGSADLEAQKNRRSRAGGALGSDEPSFTNPLYDSSIAVFLGTESNPGLRAAPVDADRNYTYLAGDSQDGGGGGQRPRAGTFTYAVPSEQGDGQYYEVPAADNIDGDLDGYFLVTGVGDEPSMNGLTETMNATPPSAAVCIQDFGGSRPGINFGEERCIHVSERSAKACKHLRIAGSYRCVHHTCEQPGCVAATATQEDFCEEHRGNGGYDKVIKKATGPVDCENIEPAGEARDLSVSPRGKYEHLGSDRTPYDEDNTGHGLAEELDGFGEAVVSSTEDTRDFFGDLGTEVDPNVSDDMQPDYENVPAAGRVDFMDGVDTLTAQTADEAIAFLLSMATDAPLVPGGPAPAAEKAEP